MIPSNMRGFIVFPCLVIVGCATSRPEYHANPEEPDGDASVDAPFDSSSHDGSGDSQPDGPAIEAGQWPGICVDGDVEECYTGPATTKDVGACKHGTHVCSDGKYPPTCDGQILPTDEQCNGIDDNCDGTVDEGCACSNGDTVPCYGGPPNTEGVGPCKGGTQTCVNGLWGACQGAVLPIPETCNGIDDDCNGSIDDKTGLRLFSMPFDGQAWSSQFLSDAWKGANAPPACANVMAAVQLTDIGRLLVFTDDGMLYWRKNGVWMAPIFATGRFPSLPATIDSVYQVPYSVFGPNLGATLTFSAVPYAYLYDYDINDSVTKADDFPVIMTDDTSKGGPNQKDVRARWSVERFDPSQYQQSADALLLYREYDDGKVYQFNAAFEWKSWSVAQSPLWQGKANAPPTAKCEAGFADHDPDKAYLICP